VQQIELHYPEYIAGDDLGYQNWKEGLKQLGKKLLDFPLNKNESGYHNWRKEFRQKLEQNTLKTKAQAPAKLKIKDLFSQSSSEEGYKKWQLDLETFRTKQRKLAGLPLGKKASIKFKTYAFPTEGIIQLTSKGNYKIDHIQFELNDIESVSICS